MRDRIVGRFLSFVASPAGLLYLYLLVTQIVRGFYIARGIETPPLFTLLYPYVLFGLVGWWLQQDSRKHNFPWVYDMGFFLFVAWPFVMPYYLFKTRGVKAFLTILIFLVVFAGAFLTGIFIAVIFGVLAR